MKWLASAGGGTDDPDGQWREFPVDACASELALAVLGDGATRGSLVSSQSSARRQPRMGTMVRSHPRAWVSFM